MRDHPTPESQAALAALVQASLNAEHNDPNIVSAVLVHLLTHGLINQREQDHLYCEEQSIEHGVMDFFMEGMALRINPNGTIEEHPL